MPAHNESKILYPVVKEMVSLNYPSYEVILINDGSSDDTSDVLKDLALKYDKVRVIDLKENCGKAKRRKQKLQQDNQCHPSFQSYSFKKRSDRSKLI